MAISCTSNIRTLTASENDDNNKIWMFLANNVILRDSNILNKHQSFLKQKANMNNKRRAKHMLQEQQAVKDNFKKQLQNIEDKKKEMAA